MIMDCKCLRCGYEWEARVNNPKECPQCKSREWSNQAGDNEKDGDNEKEKRN
jgi:predicted Zn-ribbon and HTH transcriptional regulator